MAFNTPQTWVTRLEPKFFLEEEKVAYTCSYTYLGVTFYRAQDLLTRGCLCLTVSWVCNSLERQCAHLKFQEPQTKLWLFDTFVTPTLLYGVKTWESSLNMANNQKNLERLDHFSKLSLNDCLHYKEQSIGAK